MAIKKYTYTVNGGGANKQTWEISGTVECEFIQMHARITQDTFRKLTDGKAIFGMPGIGCEGPYDVHKIVIEQIIPPNIVKFSGKRATSPDSIK